MLAKSDQEMLYNYCIVVNLMVQVTQVLLVLIQFQE